MQVESVGKWECPPLDLPAKVLLGGIVSCAAMAICGGVSEASGRNGRWLIVAGGVGMAVCSVLTVVYLMRKSHPIYQRWAGVQYERV